MSKTQTLQLIQKFIPKLGSSLHKGQSGKIGIVGGSFEYTGAPYYAGISSLKTGVDIAHIFCDESAATAIKSYSPEAIVHPVLKQKNSLNKQSEEDAEKQIVEKVSKWFQSIHVLIVGPGLGRDEFVMKCAKQIIIQAKSKNIPVIIDGDGINLVVQDAFIIKGYKLGVLTPNVAEFDRLLESQQISKLKEEEKDETSQKLKELSKKLENVTILQKGNKDVITDGKNTLTVDEEGNSRRSGGQGDILTGSIAAFLAWSHDFYNNKKNEESEYSYPLLSCYGGCTIVRAAGKEAFNKHKRSTTTPDVISEIGPSFEKLFPSKL